MLMFHRMIVATLALALAAFGTADFARAQSNTPWLGEYFNNIYLIGTPAATRDVAAISFDWGASEPVPGVNADNFSVRWTKNEVFSNATYRFYAQADDEINVVVDGRTIISTFDQNRAGQLVSADITLSAGLHQIQVNYRELSGNASAFVSWANVANNPQPPAFSTAQQEADLASAATEPVDVGLWTAQYYGNNSLAGLPTAILGETAIDFDWGDGAPVPSLPTDDFSARWTTLATLEGGIYRFTARADDSVRVLVDAQPVIDNWEGAVARTTTVDVELTPGDHNIMVDYREFGGDAFVTVEVARVNPEAALATPIPTPAALVPTNTGATGTVDAFRLNVRAAPTTDGRVVAKIERGETYPIVGRNADRSWWQLDVNGAQGWVFAPFIIDANTGAVPVTSQSSQVANVPGTGYFATALNNVNLRSRPTTAGAVLGQFPRGAQAEVTGRNVNGSWVQINYNGTLAWVSSEFISVPVPTTDIPLASE
jgi:uncharacterized protein YraI